MSCCFRLQTWSSYLKIRVSRPFAPSLGLAKALIASLLDTRKDISAVHAL